MKISLLCSSEQHPIMPHLQHWKTQIENSGHQVTICSKKSQLGAGDILFLISCSERIGDEEYQKYQHVLVLHASDLPKGRGWSPHIWEILNGSETIIISLIEAAENIDTGDVWKKIAIPVEKHLLYNDINDILFQGELELMTWAVSNKADTVPKVQDLNEKATYWPRRTPQDSRLEAEKSIEEQFDLLRICDPDRYPAYFELYGRKYKIRLEYYDEEKQNHD
jgi:methionyl-tRNA formyltransferase